MSLAHATLGQIAIVVQDPARAAAFYKNSLGLRHLFSAGPLSFFDCGGVRLMLSTAERPELDHASSILYFKVADIKATHAEMAAKGVRFEGVPHRIARMPDHDLWLAEFRDSEKNVMALMSEVRPPATA